MDQAARYSVQERIKIVEAVFAMKSVVQSQRKFRRDFLGRDAPIRFTIKRLLDKFRETGSLQDITIKVAVADHGQSGQETTLWL